MRLFRQQGSRAQYYDIRVYPTLFNEFVLIHQCGKRACMKKGTREYFGSKKEALLHSLTLLETKRLEGYTLKTASR